MKYIVPDSFLNRNKEAQNEQLKEKASETKEVKKRKSKTEPPIDNGNLQSIYPTGE